MVYLDQSLEKLGKKLFFYTQENLQKYINKLGESLFN